MSRDRARNRRRGLVESLLAPMLTPTTPGPVRRCSRASAASCPPLLKPSRLITARSRGRRNTRGLGLPGCGSGVTVPISAKPQPSRKMASGTRASLSKPAAIPTGFGSDRPANETASEAWSNADGARKHAKLQRLERHLVRFLGRKQRECARCIIKQHFQHAVNSLGSIGTPSIPSGSACTAPAVAVGSAA